jgi:MFS family permease
MDTTERLLLGAEQRKYRTLLLAALGGVLENYDFILFALFTKVLSQLFFPPTMPEWIAIVQTFGIFAAGNLARVLQGAATGGELPGAWTFVAEQVPKNRVGLACGVLVSALSVGNLLAALAVTALSRLFHPWEILAFAWRLPFMVGGIFALLSVYVRRWLTESPVFRELQGKRRLAAELPLKIVLRRHGIGVLVSAALTSLVAVTIVVVFVMTPTLLQTAYGIDADKSFEASSLATICFGVSCVLGGFLVDGLGTSMFLILCAPVSAACVYMLFALLPGHPEEVFTLYAIAGGSVGIVACVPTVLVESFPPVVRFTGIAFSYNLAFALFGGVTPPLVAVALEVDALATAHAVLLTCGIAFVVGCARLLGRQKKSMTLS